MVRLFEEKWGDERIFKNPDAGKYGNTAAGAKRGSGTSPNPLKFLAPLRSKIQNSMHCTYPGNEIYLS
jgi:hypothetical protein